MSRPGIQVTQMLSYRQNKNSNDNDVSALLRYVLDMVAVLELAYWQRTNACIGQHPLRGVLCFPHPREGGPKKLTCSRRVRLGCWVGLGANTPCTFGTAEVVAFANLRRLLPGLPARVWLGPPGTRPHLRLLRTLPNYHYPDCILRTPAAPISEKRGGRTYELSRPGIQVT